MIRALFVFTILLLSGCASQTQLSITYASDPSGAVLYSGGNRIGYTPYTLYYNISEEAKKNGFINIAGSKVQWASGAEAEIKPTKIDITKHGVSKQIMFNRPNGVPGIETDIRLSLEIERTRAMQQQAIIQEERAAAERYRTHIQRPINCTSTVIGDTIYTYCP